jgi:hypothetical protein
MVAAEVDPELLVFVDEMGVHTSLAPLYGYSRRGERVHLQVPRNLKAQTRRSLGLDDPSWRDGRDDGRRGLHEPGSLRGLRRARLGTHLRSRRGCDHGQPLKAHKPARVRELIEERGCELIYLPAYSPDFRAR